MSTVCTIWIDNDACPRRVREVVFKAAQRLGLRVCIVANSYMHPPKGLDVQVIVAGSGFDAADDHIATHVAPGDLVVTADVPLADRVVEAGGIALSPRGVVFDAASIKEQLAMRNLHQELRGAGEIHGGPPAFDSNDVQKFASAFDRILTARTTGR